MLDRIAQLPLGVAFLVLAVAALLRSNATYWIGRGGNAGWHRVRDRRADATDATAAAAGSPVGEDLQPSAETVRKERLAEAMLRRLGPLAVTLSYLTVGVQTAIHLTAGAVRMPLRWYLPAAVVGSAIWGALYATVGIAVAQAWVAAEAGSWGGVVVLAVAAVALTAWLVARRRATRADHPTADTP